MFARIKRQSAPAADHPAAGAAAGAARAAGPDLQRMVQALAGQASMLGRESAEVRGAIDDTTKVAAAQAQAVQELAAQLRQVMNSQQGIADETQRALGAVAQVGDAVQAVGAEVGDIVDTLHRVSEAAAQITQIALQTRLVAFNASVEAKRAGEAGRGFGVVADAVKELAAQVESSSKQIMGTVTQLDQRIAALARDVRREPPAQAGGRTEEGGAVHRALAEVVQGVQRIHAASAHSRSVCDGLGGQTGAIERAMRHTSGALAGALERTETFLGISEQLLESVAECGIETEDTPYVRTAQQAAAQIDKLLEDALRTGAIDESDLFDTQYRALPGTAPEQHTTRCVELADRLFPQVQEKALTLSDKVVFCIAVDRNGYVACHNRQYNHRQRPGDVAWNTANCRNRRIFADRTGLASARNERPFLLQTYRRDMGGGNFIVMKEAAAPIRVGTRHWGGLRLAYRF